MLINRDISKHPVIDFISNVKPKLNNYKVAEEVYEGSMLVGWKIVDLVKR